MSIMTLAVHRADKTSPLTTLRDTLRQPESASPISSSKLSLLLGTYHLDRLRSPWQPFKTSSGPSTSKAGARTITIPGTSVTFEADADLVRLADQLCTRAQIHQDEAVALCKSYEQYSLDDSRGVADDGRIARILAWWSEEAVAVAEISTTVLLLGSGTEDQSWGDLAAGIRDTLMSDPEKWIEGLFRAFSGLAQTALTGAQRSEYPLLWSVTRIPH